MTDIANDPPRRLLLVGHGLIPGISATGLYAGRVPGLPADLDLYQLPVPAFELRPQGDASSTPHVAERLAELDELEQVFEELAAFGEQGHRVLGLAVAGRVVNSRSGRAWLERVRAIAQGIAGLSLEVWTVTAGQASLYDATAQPIRTAS
ncbi:hypothetical protein [Micropruina sonneratiae]|uniref:hypothetical protein n=1 Tax=Micropruina sonneratiae TaxID=2986940 RepID=UPI002227D1C8|nr:hypothetical protein [Micropruina sp. KQZ13P-5]MCW3159129.1 hypothetical protein [Micropruina sp. KQZ13P-5]